MIQSECNLELERGSIDKKYLLLLNFLFSLFVQFNFSSRQLFLFVPRPVHSGTGERFYQSKEAKCAAKRAPPKSSRINFPISIFIFNLEDNCFKEWIKFVRLERVKTGSPPHLDCGLGKLTKTKTD